MIMLDQPARLDAYWRAWHGSTLRSDMKELQTLRTQYRVSDFVAWRRDGALWLNPDFQRRSVWSKGAKSYLIDTILRGLPVPIIFIRDWGADLRTLKRTRDVVDGQQRLRTILAFIDPKLVDDFEVGRDDFTISEDHNEELAGRGFRDLSLEFQKRILDYQFSVHSFPSDTDDREILQIFARMNSTGYGLNAQELRNAEFFGAFKSTALNLATEQLNRWREWRIFTPDQIARMNEFELTSEFMILIMRGVLEKSAPIIDAFYGEFDKSFGEGKEVSSRFRRVMDTIEASFDKSDIISLFRKRTLFYALFACIYGIQYGLRKPPEARGGVSARHKKTPSWLQNVFDKMPPITRKKPVPVKDDAIAHIIASGRKIRAKEVSPEVQESLRGATSHAVTRRKVIGFLAGNKHDP